MKKDITIDQNPRPLYKAAAEMTFPAYVEGADLPTPEECAGLQPSAFAMPEQRLHPLHTKAAAYLTAVYLAGQEDALAPEVIGRVKQAAAVHGISEDVLPWLERMVQVKEATSRPDMFALRDGTHAFYPIGTRYDIEHSVDGICRDIRTGRLPVKEARQACLALVKRANEIGYSDDMLPETVRQMGTETLARTDAILKQAAWRERVTGCEVYKQAAELFAENPTEDNRQAGAEAWEQLDALCDVKASAVTPAVPDVWFDGPSMDEVKQAADRSVWFGQEVVPVETLTLVDPEAWQSWYGSVDQAKVAAVMEAAGRSGLEASNLLDQWTPNERAVLAGHLQRHYRAR